jgi:hypothetical protein
MSPRDIVEVVSGVIVFLLGALLVFQVYRARK